MRTSQTTLKVIFAILCAVAVISALWGFLNGGGTVPALVVAVILLVAAQLLLFMMISSRQAGNDRADVPETLSSRLGNLEQQIKRLSRLRAVPDQSKSEKTPAITPQGVKGVKAVKVGNAPAPPVPGPSYLDDQRLSLYLEPVVEVSSRITKFYRAELAFESARSGRILLADITDQIVKDGHSADVDMKLFARLGPVIDRLAQKGRVAGVICPMSRHSFSNQDFLAELTRHLKQYPQLARVLVIEISQENLAGLSQDGMAGLAFLAQIGATFSLGGAGLESPDLNSLASLGFRYLDLDYSENTQRYGLQAFSFDGPAAKLRDAAKKVDIQFIFSGLVRKSQCDAVNHIISFGRGPVFSAPRLVRRDFGNQHTKDKAA